MVGGDGLMAVQQVMKRRDIRAFGMAALHGLVELLRIAEQHDGPGSLGDGEDIRQRHLRGLVDEQHVDRCGGIGPRPEPGRGRGDLACGADCREQRRIVLRKAQPRLIRFDFADLLHAADIDAHFPGGFDHAVEQIADHLVTVGGDADGFAGAH